MNDVADEVKIKILSYLPLRDLSQVSLVSFTWYQLANDKELWCKINLREFPHITDGGVISLLTRHPYITHFKGRKINPGSDNIKYTYGITSLNSISECTLSFICTQCAPYLTHLNLNRCDEVTSDLLSVVAQYCKCLEHLDIGNNPNIDDMSMVQIAQCPALRSLVVSRCDLVTDNGLSILCNGRHIVLLDASFLLNVRTQTIQLLVKYSSTSLSTLYLDGANLTDNDIRSIGKLQALCTLNIQYCDELTDDGLSYLACIPNLSNIRLYRCFSLSSPCLSDIVRSLSLRSLTLTDCSEIDDRALQSLGSHCPTLQTLELSQALRTTITDVGLGAVLVGCLHLHSLTLRGIKSIRTFVTLIPLFSLRNLRYLHLGGCQNVPTYALEVLAALCPRISIYGRFASRVEPLELCGAEEG